MGQTRPDPKAYDPIWHECMQQIPSSRIKYLLYGVKANTHVMFYNNRHFTVDSVGSDGRIIPVGMDGVYPSKDLSIFNSYFDVSRVVKMLDNSYNGSSEVSILEFIFLRSFMFDFYMSRTFPDRLHHDDNLFDNARRIFTGDNYDVGRMDKLMFEIFYTMNRIGVRWDRLGEEIKRVAKIPNHPSEINMREIHRSKGFWEEVKLGEGSSHHDRFTKPFVCIDLDHSDYDRFVDIFVDHIMGAFIKRTDKIYSSRDNWLKDELGDNKYFRIEGETSIKVDGTDYVIEITHGETPTIPTDDKKPNECKQV